MSATLPHCSDAYALAEAIAHLCEDAHPYQDGWRARCPNHQGHSATSLSITPADDRVLMMCFGTCASIDVVKTLGLTMADLFVTSPARRNGQGRIVKVYEYYDADGTLVHETVRYAPKNFRQRRPDPARPGEYIWNLQGITPVLYHLPQVLAAVQRGETIYLAEGEKDADNLQSLGVTTTCNAMGAGKWRKSYSEVLRGAHVVLLPHHDDPGQHHALTVAKALDGIAATLKIVSGIDTGTPGSDVSDWLQAGGTRTKLEALTAAMPLWEPQATSAPADIALPLGDPATSLDTVSPCTHVANAHRLARDYTDRLHYVLGRGWIVWTGQFWRTDPTAEGALATGFVSGLARAIAREAATLLEQAAQEGESDRRVALMKLADARLKWAVQSENERVIAAGLKLAKQALLIEHRAVDTDPWLFNCQNGTLNLRTGTLQPHQPTDLLTHIAPVTFDPAATCPTWERFLSEVFGGDPAMVRFIQRALGWSLTAVVQERALFFLYGPKGHNGKTTLVETWRAVLGDCGEDAAGYARKVDVGTFMKQKNDDDNKRKAVALAGPRFVYSSEVDAEHRLNEQLLKDITGGDTLEGRRLYREAFTFTPTFKPWMYGNHKPDIRGTDDALWSRVKLVPFEVSFADRVDLQLPDKLRAELSGILNWAIQGCLDWQRDGLQPPEKVKTATKEYRQEQDEVGRFICECCDVLPAASIKATRLYGAYHAWCDKNGCEALSQKRFGAYMTTHDFPPDNNITGRGIIRRGLDLMKVPDPEDDANLSCEKVSSPDTQQRRAKTGESAQNANLPNLGTDNPPRERSLGDLSEVRLAKVSTSEGNTDDTQHRRAETAANLYAHRLALPEAPCPHTWIRVPRGNLCTRCNANDFDAVLPGTPADFDDDGPFPNQTERM